MYTERFSLPFLAQVLMAAAERRRPGLGRWSPEVKAELRRLFESELAEVRARFFELFDDRAHWERVERAVLDDVFVRYCAAAEKQTELEQRGFGIWRNGDLVSRIVLGVGGLAAGVFIARAPFIPLPTSADIVVMLSALGTPMLPDLQVWLYERRYKKALARIVEDMAVAQKQHQLYQPLPISSESELSPVSEVSAEASRSASAERSPTRG